MLDIGPVPIGALHHHPDNARQGDIGAIATSLEANGQYRAIVVNRRSADQGWDMDESQPTVVAGNHTLAAARHLGWDTIDVQWVDVDRDTELRILLVDNRTNDLATYDTTALADLLVSIAPSLEGTGYDGDDLDQLLADIAPSDDLAGFDRDDRYTPAWIFEKLAVRFDLDPAGPPVGSNVPADRTFTEADDGLTQDWFGTVWLNPPFSNGHEWAAKWIAHGDGFFLGPVSSARWPHDVFAEAAFVWFPAEPLQFDTPHPDLTSGINYATFIAATGPQAEALLNLADDGVILRQY